MGLPVDLLQQLAGGVGRAQVLGRLGACAVELALHRFDLFAISSSLRHTFCAHMVMAGVPLRRVQILAGHADYATTEKFYAHLTPEGDDGAMAKLRY